MKDEQIVIKKEKMAAHPIAVASITLPLPLSLCPTEHSQLGERAANQEAETGGGLPLPPPNTPSMLCCCSRQTDRVTERARTHDQRGFNSTNRTVRHNEITFDIKIY